jgi:hydrogenase maturation protease
MKHCPMPTPPSVPTPATLIIGVGNPLRSDDALGQVAAAALEAAIGAAGGLSGSQGQGIGGIEVIACHQLMPELVEPISRAVLVIFIDAGLAGVPGEIRCQRVEAVGEGTPPTTFTHNATPGALLAAAAAWYQRVPAATYLYTVTGANFEHGMALSEAVRGALPALVSAVLKRCREHRSWP